MNQIYLDTARLMIQAAPLVFAGDVFALKGGTAINLFIRDMPRLSVDLDLVFPEHTLPREQALNRITTGLRDSAKHLKARGFQTRNVPAQDASETKLLVRRDGIEIKIEVNFVLRGTLHPVRTASLTKKARATLLADLELPVVSLEDVYGGKLVAALDRQHPRDLFDVMQLYAHEGITDGIRRAFVVYLACHNRPVHEVLFPALHDIRREYERTFQGMTTAPVALSSLIETRDRLIHELHERLDSNERQFLISLVQNKPEWRLLGFKHLEDLPGIRWKMRNLTQLSKTDPKKFGAQADELGRLLS
jgi:predicted nucleotidyltransferase component of viral defense system